MPLNLPVVAERAASVVAPVTPSVVLNVPDVADKAAIVLAPVTPSVVLTVNAPVTPNSAEPKSSSFVPLIANPSLFAPIRYNPVPVSVDR